MAIEPLAYFEEFQRRSRQQMAAAVALLNGDVAPYNRIVQELNDEFDDGNDENENDGSGAEFSDKLIKAKIQYEEQDGNSGYRIHGPFAEVLRERAPPVLEERKNRLANPCCGFVKRHRYRVTGGLIQSFFQL